MASSKHRVIFFADFDGTITTEDMCDWLVETEGFGPEKLRETSQAVIDGTMSYREASRSQLESVKLGFDTCVEKAIAHVRIDQSFVDFYNWASSVGLPIIILSGGLNMLIEAILEKFLGSKAPTGIEVVANSVVAKDGFQSINGNGRAWKVQFRDDSVYGNDKAQTIKLYREKAEAANGTDSDKPVSLFAGDGISDLGAAGETDILFAKQGEDLAKYCTKNLIPHVKFQDWASILKTTQEL